LAMATNVNHALAISYAHVVVKVPTVTARRSTVLQFLLFCVLEIQVAVL